jgi:hypothetical protein
MPMATADLNPIPDKKKVSRLKHHFHIPLFWLIGIYTEGNHNKANQCSQCDKYHNKVTCLVSEAVRQTREKN